VVCRPPHQRLVSCRAFFALPTLGFEPPLAPFLELSSTSSSSESRTLRFMAFFQRHQKRDSVKSGKPFCMAIIELVLGTISEIRSFIESVQSRQRVQRGPSPQIQRTSLWPKSCSGCCCGTKTGGWWGALARVAIDRFSSCGVATIFTTVLSFVRVQGIREKLGHSWNRVPKER